MGGKGGDEASKEAQQARADEQARQERIRQGTQRISQIFEGGATSGVNPLTAGTKYDPKKTYFTSAGTPWVPPPNPMTSGVAGTASGGSYQMQNKNGVNRRVWVPNTSADIAKAAKTPEQLFTEALAGGQVFGGKTVSKGTFGPDYYKNLEKSYVDYATPQLVDKYGDAQRQLIYALDR